MYGGVDMFKGTDIKSTYAFTCLTGTFNPFSTIFLEVTQPQEPSVTVEDFSYFENLLIQPNPEIYFQKYLLHVF